MKNTEQQIYTVKIPQSAAYELTGLELNLYLHYSNAQIGKSSSHWSTEGLAEALKVSKSSIKRAKKGLIEKEYIIVSKAHPLRGQSVDKVTINPEKFESKYSDFLSGVDYTSSVVEDDVYEKEGSNMTPLSDAKIEGGSNMTPLGGSNMSSGGVQICTPKELKRKTKNNKDLIPTPSGKLSLKGSEPAVEILTVREDAEDILTNHKTTEAMSAKTKEATKDHYYRNGVKYESEDIYNIAIELGPGLPKLFKLITDANDKKKKFNYPIDRRDVENAVTILEEYNSRTEILFGIDEHFEHSKVPITTSYLYDALVKLFESEDLMAA